VVYAIALGSVVDVLMDMVADVEGSNWDVGVPKLVVEVAERRGTELDAGKEATLYKEMLNYEASSWNELCEE
jgi:hypothetical protein